MNDHASEEYDLYAESAIEDAFRTSPLRPAPPLLYAAVMRRVRQQSTARQQFAGARQAALPAALLPSFRVSWLDLALGLFCSSMFGVLWLVWFLIPANWLSYFRLEAMWSWQKLWYLDSYWWIGTGAGLLLVLLGMVAAIWSWTKTGVWNS